MKIKDIVNDLGVKIYRENSSTGELYCYCPFHKNGQEESPSFNINIMTGRFQCWTCGVKGYNINELSKLFGGKKYILDEDKWFTGFKNKLYPLKTPQKEAFIPSLPFAVNNAGETFLKNRGLTTNDIKKWKLMYWKDINSVVIPAETIGYIIRYIDPPDKKKKYKYITGTRITDCLFGEVMLSHNTHPFTILVEGSLDVIAMHQKGFDNTLGLLHSAISDKQLQILRRYQYPVYLMLDPDEAGRAASNKIKQKLRGEFLVKVCELPEEKDPDECTIEELKHSLTSARRWNCIDAIYSSAI